MNQKDESFKDFILDQLRDLDNLDARRMFGGFGLYQDEIFFGIVHKDRLFFKIDDSTVGEYRKRKMKPFRPSPKQTLRSTIKCRWRLLKMRISLRTGHAGRCFVRSRKPSTRHRGFDERRYRAIQTVQ